jgi:hypothetical protein
MGGVHLVPTGNAREDIKQEYLTRCSPGRLQKLNRPRLCLEETDTFKEFSEKAAFDAHKISCFFSQSPLSLQLCKNGLEHYGTASDTSDK